MIDSSYYARRAEDAASYARRNADNSKYACVRAEDAASTSRRYAESSESAARKAKNAYDDVLEIVKEVQMALVYIKEEQENIKLLKKGLKEEHRKIYKALEEAKLRELKNLRTIKKLSDELDNIKNTLQKHSIDIEQLECDKPVSEPVVEKIGTTYSYKKN